MSERETCPVCGNPNAVSEHCVDDDYGDYYKAHCGKCGWEFDGRETLIEATEENEAMTIWLMDQDDQ